MNQVPDIRLSLRTYERSPSLVGELTMNCGYWAKEMGTGGVLVKLPIVPNEKHQEGPFRFMVPSNLPKVEQLLIDNGPILIEADEAGGFAKNSTLARIVCSSSGEALKPYHVPPKVEECGKQALFCNRVSLVTINVNPQTLELTIMEHRVARDIGYALLHTHQLWQGAADIFRWRCQTCKTILTSHKHGPHECANHDGDTCNGLSVAWQVVLPDDLKRFENAATAAIQKASCLNCRCAHYRKNSNSNHGC